MENEKQTTNVVVAKSTKNVGVAIGLSLFFGPLGMLYSTIWGAIIMAIISIVVGILTFGIGLIVTIPIGVIWAAIAANLYNKRLLNGKV